MVKIIPTKKRVLSGIQPSGRLHVGNFLGMLQNAVALQDEYDELFYPIVDLHSLSADFDPTEKHEQIINLALDMLASGIDPKKSAVFQQSEVQEHASLAIILGNLTSMGELERMTQFKDKSERQEQNINLGLFSYPVLMASDILIYKPNAVPVGDDQKQHIELTRTIAKRFNHKFGETFPLPKGIFTKTPRVMSLLAPSKKMSKTLGDNHCIYLSDEPAVIQKKIAKAVTATNAGSKEMPDGVKNLFILLENFGNKKDNERLMNSYKDGSLQYSELKKVLAESISEYFSDFRKKRKALAKSPEKVEQILKSGAGQARKIASKTLEEVKQKIGLAK